MQYLVEQGSSHREVLEKVRARYGEAAQVLSHRTVRSGGFLGLFTTEGVEITFYLKDDAVRESEKKKAEIEEDKRRLLEKVSQERAFQEVLAEVRSLRDTIVESAVRPATSDGEHPVLGALERRLAENDFSAWYRGELLERARSAFSLGSLDDAMAVDDAVLEWIGDAIKIPQAPRAVKPRVVVLVGPTGVGKTTTIAKLAALHNLGIGGVPAQDVRMITIDSYRIGARQQIETYGSIMRVPVSSVETASDLRQTIAMYRDIDLILVDTIGKSPRDAVRLAEMQQILDACGPSAEVYLAVAATTKTQDMLDIFRQFEPFRYRGIVVTKMDETGRVGNVLSALAETDKAVAWITDGQKVPQDIAPAHPLRFLMSLEGFNPNRPKLEERYGLLPRSS
ncbi:MAG: flagellar biosynthesis protein FlhF [Spirochaetales bacterium]|nr:flagellar biosynthesis protein FlhF [Spirochaetales bacterium]